MLLQAFFSKWGAEGIVDLKVEFSKLIALTAARTLLGREIREQLFDEVSCGATATLVCQQQGDMHSSLVSAKWWLMVAAMRT